MTDSISGTGSSSTLKAESTSSRSLCAPPPAHAILRFGGVRASGPQGEPLSPACSPNRALTRPHSEGASTDDAGGSADLTLGRLRVGEEGSFRAASRADDAPLRNWMEQVSSSAVSSAVGDCGGLPEIRALARALAPLTTRSSRSVAW